MPAETMSTGIAATSHTETSLQYNSFASAYQTAVTEEELWKHSTTFSIHELIGGTAQLKGKRVIDIACGEGILSRWAAEQGAAYVLGIDSSEKQIELAAATVVKGVEYRTQDIQQLVSEKFDVAIASHLLCYAENIEQLRGMVRGCASALEDGGRLVGVREISESKAGGKTPREGCDTKGKLKYSFKLSQPDKNSFCQCQFNFGNSDGTTFAFHTFALPEELMLKLFREEGFEVVSAGPMLKLDEQGKKLFSEEFQKHFLNTYGKVLWYFDLRKSAESAEKRTSDVFESEEVSRKAPRT